MHRATLISELPSPAWDDRPDADLLQAIQWRKHAPDGIVAAARDGDVAAFCRELRGWRFGCEPAAWKQSELKAIEISVARPHDAAARWGRLYEVVQGFDESTSRGGRSARKDGRNRDSTGLAETVDRLRDWLEELRVEGELSPAEQGLLHELLLRGVHALPDDVLWLLWRTLLVAALEMSSEHLSAADRQCDTSNGNARLELAWQTSLLFRGVRQVFPLGKHARRALREELTRRTDADGTPQADLLWNLEQWLAPLIRARQWAEWFDVRLWGRGCEARFASTVRFAASLLDGAGRAAFDREARINWPRLLDAAARLTSCGKGEPPRSLLRALARGERKSPGSKWHARRSPARQSDEAEVAVLRNRWSSDADTLVVAHHAEQPWVDLSVFGRPLMSGVWNIELSCAGLPLRFPASWSCVCWHSDADADYLELQLTFDGNLRVERQALLSRNDHLLFLADTVFDPAGNALDYRSRLPLAAGWSISADAPTREVRLGAAQRSARVFPLALEQDRVLSSAGRLAAAQSAAPGCYLEVAQSGVGGVYAPLAIDWHPGRRKAQADWRTLTIAEHRRVVPRHIASAHRLRIGDRQWLFYHALVRSPEPRTVLGLHTFRETVIGRVSSGGDIEPILLVE